MLFTVHQEALDGPEPVLDRLDRILTRVEDDVHEMDLLPADLLEESHW